MRAQKNWAKLAAVERGNCLRQIAAKIRDRADFLARVITEEQGKPLGLSKREVEFTANYLVYMAEWARRIEGEILTSDRPNEHIFLFRQPIGVVAGDRSRRPETLLVRIATRMAHCRQRTCRRFD
jgi:lactaldehyde dehydrogenase/glycolaldehyde dehydrogenase